MSSRKQPESIGKPWKAISDVSRREQSLHVSSRKQEEIVGKPWKLCKIQERICFHWLWRLSKQRESVGKPWKLRKMQEHISFVWFKRLLLVFSKEIICSIRFYGWMLWVPFWNEGFDSFLFGSYWFPISSCGKHPKTRSSYTGNIIGGQNREKLRKNKEK